MYVHIVKSKLNNILGLSKHKHLKTILSQAEQKRTVGIRTQKGITNRKLTDLSSCNNAILVVE